jgi:hypothetical protein
MMEAHAKDTQAPHGNGNGAHANGDGDAAVVPQRVHIRELNDLARRYDFSEPDGYVGSESGKLIFDYGPPYVLADSARVPHPPRRFWQRLVPWLRK